MLKAVLHAHSTYSDGEFTLSELRELFFGQGCSVLCITDHAESFDAEKLDAYVMECSSLSHDGFLFVPGLEFECEQRMHILGYGSTTLANTKDPEAVIRHIEAHSGLAVIAHPKDTMFPWIETFQSLPLGIETWNSKYDGRYAPRPGTFDLLSRLRSRRREMKAFYGQDLHWRKQFRGLFVELQTETLSRESVLDTLARGQFTAVKGDLRLSSAGELSTELRAQFTAQHAKSDRMRRFLRTSKEKLDRLGLAIPAPIKSQLRRIF